LPPLKFIWLATDQMCGPRLKAAMPLWLPFYEAKHALSPEVKHHLLSASARTLDRLLKPLKHRYPKQFRASTAVPAIITFRQPSVKRLFAKPAWVKMASFASDNQTNFSVSSQRSVLLQLYYRTA
jgi:hypothetical protein